MKTIAQSITEKAAELTQHRDQLQTLVAKSESGEDVGEQIDDVTIKAEAAEKELERLKRVEKAMGARATPADDGNVTQRAVAGFKAGVKQGGDSSPPGTLLARLAIARGVAHVERKPLVELVERMFPDDKGALAIAKTATNAADTTTAGWAAELVKAETYGMLITDLVPVSVAAALSRIAGSLDFDGAATIKVPTQSNTTKALGGAWVGENGVIPVKQGTVGSMTISRYKLAVITVLTRELIRSASANAVEKIRQMMLNDTGNVLDSSLIDALPAVTGVRPAGLLNGVTVTAGAAGGGSEAVVTDLKTMYNKMIVANVGERPVLMVNKQTKFSLSMQATALGEFIFASEVAGGNLRGFPIIASSNVPAGYAIMVDAAYFASAFDTPEVDISEQATLTMANADGVAPTQAMDNAGALGTAEQVLPDRGINVAGGVTGAAAAGYRAMSLFQTWTLGQRLILPASWAVTRAGAVQAVSAITW